MEAKEKRKLEREKQAESRRQEICEAALQQFVENGIDNTRMEDVAKYAEVGPATVYRYFENKQNLVAECAAGFWSRQVEQMQPQLDAIRASGKSGYEQVEALLKMAGGLYRTNPVWLRFLEQFDNYVVREKIPKDKLTAYERGIFQTQDIMLDAIWAGQSDGSIHKELDGKSFCVTIIHAITALSQKLLMRGDVLQSDHDLDAETQIRMMVEMALQFIKMEEQ